MGFKFGCFCVIIIRSFDHVLLLRIWVDSSERKWWFQYEVPFIFFLLGLVMICVFLQLFLDCDLVCLVAEKTLGIWMEIRFLISGFLFRVNEQKKKFQIFFIHIP